MLRSQFLVKLALWYIAIWVSFINFNLRLVNSESLTDKNLEKSKQIIGQRKLDSPLHYATLERTQLWYGFGVTYARDDPYDLYLPEHWAIFISSNETLLGSETCPLIGTFVCDLPNCSEDSSLLYSQNYSQLLIYNATRLNLIAQELSIAGGAWKLDSSPLYVHNCKFAELNTIITPVRGQIGLGLSGQAYKNYQTINLPIFSIVFHSINSGELIFGFNTSYVSVSDTSSGITLPCDLDWKMQVHGLTIRDTLISKSAAVMIFDLQTTYITLPASYYYDLRAYLFNTLNLVNCHDQISFNTMFICLYGGNLQDLPPLEFILDNGIQFSLSPASYTTKETGGFSVIFNFHNSTLMGADYIILGRETMFQHYIVFQQLTNETATITLYPHPIETIPWIKLDSTSSTDSSESTMIGHASSPDNPETKTEPSVPPEILPYESPVENTVSGQDDSSDSSGSDNTILFTVICIVIIVVICVLSLYLAKRGELRENNIEERQRSTVELNESSYFVKSDNDLHNEKNGGSEESS